MYLSIIIPYCNEKETILENLRKINKFFYQKYDYEILLIIDTGNEEFDILSKIKEEITNIRIYINKRNYGKGYSIRKGIDLAKGNLILTTDADLSTPIYEYEKLHDEIINGYNIVIGSRNTIGSNIILNQGILRIIAGKIFNMSLKIILGLKFKDSQCGFKLFKSEPLKKIIKISFINRFCIDPEILYIAKKLDYSISEIGISWVNNKKTSVKLFSDSIDMFISLIKILITHYRIK